MLVYRSNRATKVKRLRADLARISAEQDKVLAAETEVARLTRQIPADASTPEFIETLYRFAKESGLKQHEVATETNKSSGSARPGGSDASSAITKHHLKVSASGSFRSFAEYIRRLQNTERFNRITEFKLAPDSSQLKGTLTIELYSIPAIR